MPADRVVYAKVDDLLKAQIKRSWQSNAGDYLHLGSDGFTVAAIADGQPIGVISAFARSLPEPLAMQREAFIDIIEVQEPYRRQGVGEALVNRVVDWAQREGLDQIRAWSEEIRLEALMLWRKTGFGFAKVDFERDGQKRYGFYAVRSARANR
jgi:GNAT superfamily N-acetyltransferase